MIADNIASLPVFDYRAGQPLRTVLQLKTDCIADSEAMLGQHPFEICAECGRKK